jgi:hypothetical protein
MAGVFRLKKLKLPHSLWPENNTELIGGDLPTLPHCHPVLPFAMIFAVCDDSQNGAEKTHLPKARRSSIKPVPEIRQVQGDEMQDFSFFC